MTKQLRCLALGVVLGSLATVSACGPEVRDLEYYGDISSGPGGVAIVSSSEHQAGWGRQECMLCHQISLNVHRRPGSGLDADAMARAAQSSANPGGYCLSCHGPNG